ncbi:epoxyqueuosine reductase, partial [bacterium 1XD42-8]
LCEHVLEQGKNHALCREYLQKTKEKFSPRFGCGKCQTGVPCEYQIPVRRK